MLKPKWVSVSPNPFLILRKQHRMSPLLWHKVQFITFYSFIHFLPLRDSVHSTVLFVSLSVVTDSTATFMIATYFLDPDFTAPFLYTRIPLSRAPEMCLNTLCLLHYSVLLSLNEEDEVQQHIKPHALQCQEKVTITKNEKKEKKGKIVGGHGRG